MCQEDFYSSLITKMNLEALLVPLTAALFYLVVCPYTKVEESFNLQAMHDVLYHGSNIAKYDHLEFPGVVPRTFIGPLAVSTLATPLVIAVDFLELNKFYTQLIVRGVLATLVLGALYFFQKAVSETLGHSVSLWFLAITTSQFHFLYYASRPLPNIMVLPLVLMACYFWIKQKHGWFIWLSACAIIWFRGELAILLGLILLGEMIGKRITIRKLLTHAIPAGVGALATTVVVDSIFWQQWLWPEGEVLWFNVVLNKSSEWGESPFLWYFYSALPRSLGTSIALIPLGAFWERRTRPLLFPALGFIFLYSFLPHKELRFIVYAIPLLNVPAAAACDRIWENRLKDNFRGVLAVGAVLHICANLLFAGFLLTVSKHNYPGGEAMKLLHRLENPEVEATVYIDNLAAQTGVSRFMEVNQRWRYDKTENLKAEKLRRFSYMLLEAKSKYGYPLKRYANSHEVLAFVECFSHIRPGYNQFPPVRVRTKPCLFILKKRKDFILEEIEEEEEKDTKDGSSVLSEDDSNASKQGVAPSFDIPSDLQSSDVPSDVQAPSFKAPDERLNSETFESQEAKHVTIEEPVTTTCNPSTEVDVEKQITASPLKDTPPSLDERLVEEDSVQSEPSTTEAKPDLGILDALQNLPVDPLDEVSVVIDYEPGIHDLNGTELDELTMRMGSLAIDQENFEEEFEDDEFTVLGKPTPNDEDVDETADLGLIDFIEITDFLQNDGDEEGDDSDSVVEEKVMEKAGEEKAEEEVTDRKRKNGNKFSDSLNNVKMTNSSLRKKRDKKLTQFGNRDEEEGNVVQWRTQDNVLMNLDYVAIARHLQPAIITGTKYGEEKRESNRGKEVPSYVT